MCYLLIDISEIIDFILIFEKRQNAVYEMRRENQKTYIQKRIVEKEKRISLLIDVSQSKDNKFQLLKLKQLLILEKIAKIITIKYIIKTDLQ